jgi:hypothetical protein
LEDTGYQDYCNMVERDVRLVLERPDWCPLRWEVKVVEISQ